MEKKTMPNIGNLVVSLRAEVAQFTSGINEANQHLRKHASEVSRAREELERFTKAVVAFAAVRELAVFLKSAAAETQAWAEKLAAFQNIAGLSSKEAATFAASAQLAGVQSETVTQAMARLGTVIANHPQKFRELGISIRDASGNLLPMVQIMRNTIAGLDGFKAGTDRAAAAGHLFGKGAEAWITQLDKLGPELKAANWGETAALVKSLGLEMENGKAVAAEWTRATGILNLEWLAFENEIGKNLLPLIKELGVDIAKFAADGTFERWGNLSAKVVRGLTTDLEFALKVVDLLSRGLAGLPTLMHAGYEAAPRESLLKNWTPSSAGSFKPPASPDRTVIPGASSTGAGAPAPDGMKTWAIAADGAAKSTANFARTYSELLAKYREDIAYQSQLRTAYQQGAAAVEKLRVAHVGDEAVMKVVNAARAQGVTVSQQEIAAVRSLAQVQDMATLAAERQKQMTENLRRATDEENRKLADEKERLLDLIDPMRKVAEEQGVWTQMVQRGLISEQQMNDAIAATADKTSGADKGMQEFKSGLSADLSTLITKATDFQALMQGQKNGQSIFQQLSQDGLDFLKSLEQMVFKLLVIKPLLDSLGLGDQGNGNQGNSQQFPTLNLGRLLGDSFKGFASGGDFTVGGRGPTDSQLVMFRATPGESVSVRPRGEGGGRVNHNINMSMTVVTPDADSFRKSQGQITADMMRHVNAGRRNS
jgi:hypothetical protein